MTGVVVGIFIAWVTRFVDVVGVHVVGGGEIVIVLGILMVVGVTPEEIVGSGGFIMVYVVCIGVVFVGGIYLSGG